MPGNNNTAASEPSLPSLSAKRVAILMGTKDGAAYLEQQLKSIADQTHDNWILIVSDDGSTDATKAIVERFAEAHPRRVTILEGPRQGVCANFLSLAIHPNIDADYFAFSDQDDVWYPDKLTRALQWLLTIQDDRPALYCARTELMSADGQCYGRSTLFARPPAFQNALVQSLGGGNTMVFNSATKALLERSADVEVPLHDWWLYQLVSGAGGSIFYDPSPVLKYRQHRHSLIGSNLGWRARLIRLGMTLDGHFRDWNAMNIAALKSIPTDIITPENRAALMLFAKATSASLMKRLAYLRQSGVYRQTLLGNIGLIAAAIIKRI